MIILGADGDSDGRPNAVDNCPAVANGSQHDGDRDGMGDACDPDGPGVIDTTNWWPGEGDANDVAGGQPGTLVSGTAFAPGKVGQAFSFDGIDDRISFGRSAGNLQTGDFTLAFHMKTSSVRQEGIIGKRPACSHGSMFDVRMSPAGRIFVELDGNSAGANYNIFSGATAVNDGQFHHIALVRKGTKASIYIDGRLDATKSTPGVTNIENDTQLIAGQSPCTGDTARFTGLLDEIIIGPDTDGDGHPNLVDNCPNAFNGIQEDDDGDATGDACEEPVVEPYNPPFMPAIESSCTGIKDTITEIQSCVYQLMPVYAVTYVQLGICEVQNGVATICQRYSFTAPATRPPVVDDDDPSKPPEGEGWVWKGGDDSVPGDLLGAWTREVDGRTDSVHPDYGTHAAPPVSKGDHWDWTDEFGRQWERPRGGRIWYPRQEEWWKFPNYLGP